MKSDEGIDPVNGENGMPTLEDTQQDVETVKRDLAVQTATQAGAQATQAATQAGQAATTAAAQAGQAATTAAMQAGLAMTVGAGFAAFVIGIILGLALSKAKGTS
jgi:hypothetical protein